MGTIGTENADNDRASSEYVPSGRTSRRNVLLGVGAVGAVAASAALASCGSNGSPSGDGRSIPEATADAGDPNIAKSTDIPVGGGKIFADKLVVVTQPTAGDFKAFSAICTHLGCTVTQISGGLITCPCHGSEYSIADGSVKRGPAPTALPARQVTVTNGEISIS